MKFIAGCLVILLLLGLWCFISIPFALHFFEIVADFWFEGCKHGR